MTLEIQICTFGKAGLQKVSQMTLPQIEGVSYFISFQNPNKEDFEISESLNRSDIEIYEHDSRGLSINRNVALEHAKADLILIADDDLEFNPGGLKQLINTFETNPELDFATFAHIGGDNKQFPDFSFDLRRNHPKGYYITSFEIALRRERLPRDIRFSTLLGIGAKDFGSGEENVFVHRLLCAGLKGKFFPIQIVRHPDVSTGNREATDEVLRGQGAWLWIRFGFLEGYLRLLRDVPRRKASILRSFYQMTKGFFVAARKFYRSGAEK